MFKSRQGQRSSHPPLNPLPSREGKLTGATGASGADHDYKFLPLDGGGLRWGCDPCEGCVVRLLARLALTMTHFVTLSLSKGACGMRRIVATICFLEAVDFER